MHFPEVSYILKANKERPKRSQDLARFENNSVFKVQTSRQVSLALLQRAGDQRGEQPGGRHGGGLLQHQQHPAGPQAGEVPGRTQYRSGLQFLRQNNGLQCLVRSSEFSGYDSLDQLCGKLQP